MIQLFKHIVRYLLFVFMSITHLNAQKIGAVIPEFKELRSLHKQLIILEFFDLTCSNCIFGVPKLNALQKQFSNRIAIIMVTQTPQKEITYFFSRNKYTKNNRLQILANDRHLSAYFKHRTVPHVAWIKNNELKGITEGEFISEEYIQAMLDNPNVKMPLKDDFRNYDYTQGIHDQDTINSVYSYLSGYKDEANRKYGIDTLLLRHSVRDYMINVPVTGSYLYAFMKLRKLPFMKPARIFVESGDPTAFVRPEEMPEALWAQKYDLCYESVLPDSLTEKQRMETLIRDLNNKLRLDVRIEKRPILCLVIRETGIPLPASEYSIKEWTNQPLEDFIFLLDINQQNSLPVINFSKHPKNIYIHAWKGEEELKNMLKINGLSIQKEVQETEVMVIGRQ
ncbi:hypothetical protein SAMN05216436_1308 [bacterium A37T11]|nr:hypothetical protein SAMN05216436_1308 [bacterium A37T11]